MRCAGFFLFFQCSAFAFQSSLLHTLSPDSLKEYVTTVPSVPAQQWIEHNADFLGYLARMPHPLSDWSQKYSNANWHLHKRTIKNHAYTNYVFQIPGTTWWIQIGGPKHRVRNVYTYNTQKNSYDYVEIAKHWELRNSNMLNSFEVVPTYQTISRFAIYLLLQEAIDALGCTHVHAAPTYLVHIPGYATHVCDEEYFVVQEHVEGIVRLRDVPERVKNIMPETVKELFNVIRHTGFWNVKNGVYINSNNDLVLLDYEQRNIENPTDFFYKDVMSFDTGVHNGLQELATIHLRPHAPKLYEQLLWLIANESSLWFSAFARQYQTMLLN